MLFMVQALKDEASDKEGTFFLTKLTLRCFIKSVHRVMNLLFYVKMDAVVSFIGSLHKQDLILKIICVKNYCLKANNYFSHYF